MKTKTKTKDSSVSIGHRRMRWTTHTPAIVLVCFFVGVSCMDEDLQPPHSVKLEAQAEHSLTISWQNPMSSSVHRQLDTFSIHYYSRRESEKEVTVPVSETNLFIGDLQANTNYTVYVTAHYSGNRSSSSPRCIMSTLDDSTNLVYKECSCYKAGTESCSHLPSGGMCICKQGYEGAACDGCAQGYYQSGDECRHCPCIPQSSTGNCELGTAVVGQVTCTCLAGYFGPLCDSCTYGHYPVGSWCIPCYCLLCGVEPGLQQQLSQQPQRNCDHCPNYSHNFTDRETVIHNCGMHGHPRSQQRSITQSDGTVAIVAVVVSLAFIASVAGGITCYRRRLQASNQVPFWSIELAEDKVGLNTGSCSNDYQRLEGGKSGGGSSTSTSDTNKGDPRHRHQRSPSVAEVTAAQRVADQPQYNCISI